MTGARLLRAVHPVRPDHATPPRHTYHWDPVTKSDIGDGACALGLITMVRHLTDPANPAGLVMPAGDVDDICDGLPVGADRQARIRALEVIAEHHDDWTATRRGAAEVARLRTWIAPYCTEHLWACIVGETVLAHGETLDGFARAVAAQNLYSALADAVDATPGPEAA